MPIARHDAAILGQEGGSERYLLVKVDAADVAQYGADDVLQFVMQNDWVREQNMPVVIAYLDGEAVRFYGREQALEALSAVDPEEIPWEYDCEVAWPDEGETGTAYGDGAEDEAAYAGEEEGDNVTRHDVAIFEEGFMVVAVDLEDVEEFGEEGVWDLIQHHDWVQEQGVPVVIAYSDEDEEVRYYGDKEIVDRLAEMPFEEITWGHELTLEWPT